ncbi:hypothetical protein A3Q56_03271 [Intoshia linei]|uniref:Tetratricopeptide repeat protein 30 n=1 Tax=Intoshia linei TaxID=1819745 RepID=A0A177B5W2_9BILA|nr:hypothetical protein A3Q56_03271 [Intoshia linei]
MSPFKTKLSTETWFYAKRCFLSLIESLSNNILLIHENTYKECIHFLVQCEVYGQTISANIEQPIPVNMLYPGKNTIIYEARILRYILMNNV